MLTGPGRAGRGRGRRSRFSRLALPIAIPVALGLVLALVFAFSSGGHADLHPTALGASASPSASGHPAPSASSSAPTTTAAPNVNCAIIVPAHPLSAKGLATPYQLTGPDGQSPAQSGCSMANAANLGAFVQATILNPASGKLFVYNPLVITQGTTPAVAPTVPRLPANAVVTIDFGFNGTDLTQVGATANALTEGNCVNGQGGSDFGQVSFCNGITFFNTGTRLERNGRLRVPSEGTRPRWSRPEGGWVAVGPARPRRTSTWSTRT